MEVLMFLVFIVDGEFIIECLEMVILVRRINCELFVFFVIRDEGFIDGKVWLLL